MSVNNVMIAAAPVHRVRRAMPTLATLLRQSVTSLQKLTFMGGIKINSHSITIGTS